MKRNKGKSSPNNVTEVMTDLSEVSGDMFSEELEESQPEELEESQPEELEESQPEELEESQPGQPEEIQEEKPEEEQEEKSEESELTKEENKKNREHHKGHAVFCIISIILVILLVGLFIGVWIYEKGLVYDVVHVEAGIPISVSDFLTKTDERAYFSEESEEFDITVPGEYHLLIHTGGFDHKCTLYIEDTMAPVVEVKKLLEIEYGKTCEPEDFLLSIDDATATKVVFINQPDYNNMDEQKIEIAVSDMGNNFVTVQSKLRVLRVVTRLEWEAGSDAPTAKDFMVSQIDSEGTILTNLEEIDFKKVGEYSVAIEVEGVEYNSVIAVVDTVAPVFTTKDIEGYAIVKRNPADFVEEENTIDVTEVTYAFETEPDVTKIGTQTVTIIGTDEGGNTCTKTATLFLKEDTEDPTIIGNDFITYLGDTISYKSKVSVKDNCMDDLVVKVDSSKVNTAAEGTYPVIYTATDAAGHSVSLTLNITIKKHTYDIDELNEIADNILAKIITSDMSQYDKAWSIFSYIRSHISYISESEKGDWVKSAYEGLSTGKGDCYVYASVSKLLLTRAGITNMDIERIPAENRMHYWNLVDIGDGHGWYHFDTTPRVDHPTIFLWDDATITEYSNNHHNCHNYDREKYPTIN